jgi:hypothetical protein
VDQAADEDTVWVTNGVYDTGGAVAPAYQLFQNGPVIINSLMNRLCISNSITVKSVNGATATVIQGGEAVRCAYLFSGAVLDGFTLTGGHGISESSEFFDMCGGGAFVFTNATLNSCIVSENSASYGGGVFSWGGTLNNCLLSGNTASQQAGGMSFQFGVMNHCTVTDNTADDTGGVRGVGVLDGCIIWGNTGTLPVRSNIDGYMTIRNTCSSPLPEGEGNICADPMFKNPNGNYRLRVGSPCVDAGSNTYAPATDLDGVVRPVDGDNNGSAIADMGCYEWSVASLPKIYFVDASRSDDSGAATNWATAKQTIQAAVDLATDEDTVWVTNGVYSIGGAVAPPFSPDYGEYVLTNSLTNRVCITNSITVRSVNGPKVTVIQGASDNGANGPAAVRGAFLLSGSVMEGFTFTGGYTHTSFAESPADCSGGGVFLRKSTALNDCILSGNSGVFGGGAKVDYGTLNNCLLTGNFSGDGGGAYVYGGTLNNCTVVGNFVSEFTSRYGERQGGWGGGVIVSAGYLNNCIVWGTTAVNEDDIVVADSMVLYSCSSPLLEGEGNICADPMFVDAVNSNFQLQAGSPCINAGNNSTVSTTSDLAGNPRVISGTVDMGAYEFYGAQDDYDGDGLPNEWEVRYFGNIVRAVSTAICSNGFNTILDAYIAGLDPNDQSSKFLASAFRSPTSENVLQWQGVSGRVYSVYYSTNLLSGFQPLETNIPWTAGAFTDTVHQADGSGFYKIHVKLAP